LTQFSLSLPNIKFGYCFSERLAILVNLPGATYQEEGLTRGFEGALVTGQFWLLDKWWINGGVGLTFDAPAFYTVENLNDANFYVGIPSISFGAGYEVYKGRRICIDLFGHFRLNTYISLACLIENNSISDGMGWTVKV